MHYLCREEVCVRAALNATPIANSTYRHFLIDNFHSQAVNVLLYRLILFCCAFSI